MMADRVFEGTSGNTLRDLRERLVAVAQELARERRRKHGMTSSAVANKRSSYTSDGSVLKNDIKQQLAKERREEQKRQQEANKEKQLFEKQQKAKVLYEKQLEEKHRKLREQKEKDERKRASAEEKRKLKQAEQKEKFKAAVSRTMERCKRVDQQQKRWSWEGGAINSEKYGRTASKQSSSRTRKESQLSSSVGLEHADNNRPSTSKYGFHSVTVPMFTSDELKSSAMFYKSSEKMPVASKLETIPTKEIETPLKADVEGPANVNTEIPPNMNMEVPSQANMFRSSKTNVEVIFQSTGEVSNVQADESPKAIIEVPTDVNLTRHPKSSVDELPMMSMGSSSSVGPLPFVSEDSSTGLCMGPCSFLSTEISPVVNMDVSADLARVEVISEEKPEKLLQTSEELHLEATMKGQPMANIETSPKNPEMGKRKVSFTIKRQPPTLIPCYKWPSSPTLGCRPPSPMKALKQNKRIRPPPPEPIIRVSATTSLTYRIIPVQNVLYVPNSLGPVDGKKETIQKPMIKTESANKNMPRNKLAAKASKALLEIHRAYKEKSKLEKEHQETKRSVTRKSEVMAEKLDESPTEEFSPHKDEPEEQYLTKRHFESAEDQKEQLQKGDSVMMKSQESAKKRKKEQEKLRLKVLQEKIERKKALEISNNCTSKKNEINDEGEANDDSESKSDEDSLEIFPSGTEASSNKLKKFPKNAKRKPQKLVFLQAGSGEIDTKREIYFHGNIKPGIQKYIKDSTTQAKPSRIPTRKPPTAHPVKWRKTKEASTTLRSTQSITTNQEWVCDKIIDLSHTTTESPVIKVALDVDKQDSKEPMIPYQGPQAPLDDKKRGKMVSAPLTKSLSHLLIAGRTQTLENPLASGCSRMPFRSEEEESSESGGMI